MKSTPVGKLPNARSVSFSAAVGIRLIPSCKDDSLAQMFLKHYTRQCFKSVREDVVKDIKDMRRGIPEDNISLSYRGIEHMASSGRQEERRKRRRGYVDAVLLEQYRQWTEHNDFSIMYDVDSESLAKIASCFSSDDIRFALEKATKDSEDAQDIMKVDRLFVVG